MVTLCMNMPPVSRIQSKGVSKNKHSQLSIIWRQLTQFVVDEKSLLFLLASTHYLP